MDEIEKVMVLEHDILQFIISKDYNKKLSIFEALKMWVYFFCD